LPLRFYTVGAWNERKNPAGIIKAYLSTFNADDHVLLMICASGVDQNEIRSLMARSGINAGKLPAIRVIENAGALGEDELREIHGAGDCYVSATRGEGWGLGLFEAAIMGRWIVAPDHGGHADFLYGEAYADEGGVWHDTGDYPWCLDVPCSQTPCFGSEVRGEIQKDPQGRMFQAAKVTIPPGVTCKQTWAEPDLADLGRRMRDLYDFTVSRVTYAEAFKAAESMSVSSEFVDQRRTAENLDASARLFADRFGYRKIGADFIHLLEEICSHG
jgi:hypothetical protein